EPRAVTRLARAGGHAPRVRAQGARARRRAGREGGARRLVVDGQDHVRGTREAARVRLRPDDAARGATAAARRIAAERVPLPVLRLDGHEARESLRPDALPQRSLLHRLPAAVRAVQDDLKTVTRGRVTSGGCVGARARAVATPAEPAGRRRRSCGTWVPASELQQSR